MYYNIHNYIVLLIGAAAIGIFFALTLSLTAYKKYVSDEYRSGESYQMAAKGKMFTMFYQMFVSVIFSLLASLMLSTHSDAANITEIMKIPTFVMCAATVICSIINGLLVKSGVEKGMLDDKDMLAKQLVKLSAGNAVTAAAFIYFIITLTKPV